MLVEVGRFGATALSLLAQLVVALGLIVLFSALAGRLMDAFAQWISPPICEAEDDANAR